MVDAWGDSRVCICFWLYLGGFDFLMCKKCNDTGRVKAKVGFHYKNSKDPIFALKVDYEYQPCPECRRGANPTPDTGDTP